MQIDSGYSAAGTRPVNAPQQHIATSDSDCLDLQGRERYVQRLLCNTKPFIRTATALRLGLSCLI